MSRRSISERRGDQGKQRWKGPGEKGSGQTRRTSRKGPLEGEESLPVLVIAAFEDDISVGRVLTKDNVRANAYVAPVRNLPARLLALEEIVLREKRAILRQPGDHNIAADHLGGKPKGGNTAAKAAA